jgi:hypothetical protein
MATIISNVLLYVPWKIPTQQLNCKFCPLYLRIFLEGEKVPSSFLATAACSLRKLMLSNAKIEYQPHE